VAVLYEFVELRITELSDFECRESWMWFNSSDDTESVLVEKTYPSCLDSAR
jgi:hypothetical protein